MKQTNQTKQSNKLNKAILILEIVFIAIVLVYVVSAMVNNYIDYRIDKYFNDNQVWYLLEEVM
jgi:hypothetical protein